MTRRIGIIGAGWAGLAAAVQACQLGSRVVLMDMAHTPGGRARTLDAAGISLDNGQHILIGAYQETLALMREVSANPDTLLRRWPLDLRYPDGRGLQLPGGPALLSFAWGVLRWHDLPLRDRLTLLRVAAGWRWRGFRCPPDWTVTRLCKGLPERVMRELIDPLCVAALNTPASQASGQVLLTVLRDALFGPPGSADLLLPAASLQELLPRPALAWLLAQGGEWRPGRRALQLVRSPTGWQIDGEAFDAVILACSAREASRLTRLCAPPWAVQAGALGYQPIVTIWLRQPGASWPRPMMALRTGPDEPAQFGFDLGQLGGPTGLFALVISGAEAWTDRGPQATAEAVQRQLCNAFSMQPDAAGWMSAEVTAVRSEMRATFACTPNLQRPPIDILPGLVAAGDYVAGPYPATLEAAVRAGRAAARRVATD